MRRERLYLADIVDTADQIAAFLVECDRSRFDASDLVQSAVMQKLSVIGEAATHVSADLRLKYPAVPWRNVISFRNILVHSYFGVDWDVVWEAATRNVPALRSQIAAILEDYPAD
jgi:uncharacterized protein with HEPN domain